MLTTARHYLDNNATAPLRPEARAAMLDAMDRLGNPSSVHTEGRAAHGLIDRARRQVAALAGVAPTAVHFTSGGTEANNWGLTDGPLLVSATSHDSALAGRDRRLLAVDGNGLLDISALEAALTEGATVSVTAINNETGVIQPLEDLADLCRSKGAPLHVDAVQAPGKIDLVPLAALADCLSLSAHKLGGPAGAGALIARGEIAPLLVGGGQENRRRAGTENLIGIAGFGAAADVARAQLPTESAAIGALREKLEAALRIACPDLVIYGGDTLRAPNTLSVRMPGVKAETQVMALDLAGVAVSAGSACSSGKVTPSHVLQAMGVPESEAAEAIRISLGWASTDTDIAACAAAWSDLWHRMQKP